MRRMALVLVLAVMAGPALAQADLARVSEACGSAALRQGLFVDAITSFAETGGAVEAAMTFRATRKRLLCTYDLGSGRVTLTNLKRYLRPPPEAETWRACERAAERQGYDVTKRLSQEDVTDAWGSPVARRVVVRARKDGSRRWRVECTYDFASKAVGVTAQAE